MEEIFSIKKKAIEQPEEYKEYVFTEDQPSPEHANADEAMNYLFDLANEKAEAKGVNLAITEMVVIDSPLQDGQDKIDRLYDVYSRLIKNGTGGIYTLFHMLDILKSRKKLSKEGGHQNFGYVDVKNKKIIRLEPNGSEWANAERPMIRYPITRYLQAVAEKLGDGWTVDVCCDKTAINMFESCRLTSTYLAAMYLALDSPEEVKRELEYLAEEGKIYKKKIKKKKPVEGLSFPTNRLVLYLLNQTIQSCPMTKDIMSIRRPGRTEMKAIQIRK